MTKHGRSQSAFLQAEKPGQLVNENQYVDDEPDPEDEAELAINTTAQNGQDSEPQQPTEHHSTAELQ